jgi:hypothetical protein
MAACESKHTQRRDAYLYRTNKGGLRNRSSGEVRAAGCKAILENSSSEKIQPKKQRHRKKIIIARRANLKIAHGIATLNNLTLSEDGHFKDA